MLHTQMSNRHKNCRIGGLMFDLEIQLQTAFYLGFSKRNITSVQTLTYRRKKFYQQTEKGSSMASFPGSPCQQGQPGNKGRYTRHLHNTDIFGSGEILHECVEVYLMHCKSIILSHEFSMHGQQTAICNLVFRPPKILSHSRGKTCMGMA